MERKRRHQRESKAAKDKKIRRWFEKEHQHEIVEEEDEPTGATGSGLWDEGKKEITGKVSRGLQEIIKR